MNNAKIAVLTQNLEIFYNENKNSLEFHGWHHIVFVRKKAIAFAKELQADRILVEAAALTHDLNYAVQKNSSPQAGEKLRTQFLIEAGFDDTQINKINTIVLEADMKTRNEHVSREAQALSDADTLFKILPITPLIFTSKYITENNVDIETLANKIVAEQVPLIQKGFYFYSDFAKKEYSQWAQLHMELWQSVQIALQDEDIRQMLNMIAPQRKK